MLGQVGSRVFRDEVVLVLRTLLSGAEIRGICCVSSLALSAAACMYGGNKLFGVRSC